MSLPNFIQAKSARQITFTFLFVLSFISAYPQQSNFLFSHFYVKDGLSHGIVNAICQDKEGFLWLGTFNGLDRFDGKNFKVFFANSRDKNALHNNVVHGVCTDKEDNIWCATEVGISKYDKRTDLFENYLLTDDSTKKVIPNGALSIICDRNGTIWCGSSSGLHEFISSEKIFKNHRKYFADSTTICDFAISKGWIMEDTTLGGLWICTMTGINFFDTKKKNAYNYRNNPGNWPVFNNHYTRGLAMTPRGDIVFGDMTTNDLVFYNVSTKKISRSKKVVLENRYNLPSEPASIFSDSKSNIWITTWGYYTFFIDAITGKATELLHDDLDPKSISSQFSWSFFEDKEGTMWLGTANGLSYYNQKKNLYRIYRPDRHNESLKEHAFIYNLHEDKKNNLWMGTLGSGLVSYNFETNIFESYFFEEDIPKKNFYNNSITSFAELNDSSLLLGTSRGIKIFNRATKSFSEVKDNRFFKRFDSSFVYQVTLQGRDTIWFWINEGPLCRYNGISDTLEMWSKIQTDIDSVELGFRYSIFCDSKHRVWLSCSQKALLCYLPDKNIFKKYAVDAGDSNALPGFPLGKMKEDAFGNMWTALAGKGVAQINPATGRIKVWYASDGLAFDNNSAVAVDHYGKVWIGGYNLLSILDPVTGVSDNHYIEFAEDDYNYLNRMLTLDNGKIVSAMLGAFAVFDPESQVKYFQPQKVLISGFRIFEKGIPFTIQNPNIYLSYKENFFSVEYGVMTGTDENKLEYQYILEGYDKDWVNAARRQLATYTNVAGGDYVFKVRARKGRGEWSPTTSINIYITKIYYQTWWFRFFVALCMFIVIRIYVRYRASQQKKAEAEQAIAYFANSEYTNHSADEIIWDLARNCISRLGFVDCVIYLHDEERNVLIQKAALGDKSEDEKTILNPLEISVGQGIVGSVAATGKTELIHDTSKDSRYIMDDASRLSELAVPIINEGKVIGVIDSEHPRRHFFNEDHKRILETIASICATKIVNAQAAQQLAENEKKLLEVDKRVAEVRLMALRAQMNPHFIFNCLNAIDNYVLKNDVEVASKYLNKFARLIRSILSVSDKNFIPLRTELELLNNYVELENLRFEEKFSFQLSIDDTINVEETDVPSMLIQPFVENAIVHGLVHKKGEKRLSIAISLQDQSLQCVIEDNGIGRSEAQRIKNSKAQTYESKGMKVTEGRLELLQQQVKEKGIVIIHDLKDENQNPAGTRVEILIPIEN